jgi:predicted methyltransferase
MKKNFSEKRLEKQLAQVLVHNQKRDFYELISFLDFDLRSILKFLKKVDSQKIIHNYRDKKEILEKINPFSFICPTCDGRGYVFNKFFKKIYQTYKNFCQERPINLPEFDQGSMIEEDTLKRVEFIYERGDLLDSEILVIGDDDLISLALALTKLPKRICVLEIDERLVNYIKTKALKYQLPIEVIKYDSRYSLPKELVNRFDIFIVDPPESLKALTIFLTRGMASLKKEGAGYFGLTTLESSLEKWYSIEKFLVRNGFLVTDIKRHFSVYPFVENWSSYQDKIQFFQKQGKPKIKNWYYSSFIRIEKMENVPIKNCDYNITSSSLYLDQETILTPGMGNKDREKR